MCLSGIRSLSDLNVFMSVYVCMCVCMYVCMCVCVYVRVYGLVMILILLEEHAQHPKNLNETTHINVNIGKYTHSTPHTHKY